ncbi:MAG TPA: 3-dehydroquinate synthase [Deltaproteobacteria bacterium]|nr:3-dehydroquinate synthase [Deltaproteobacteria bacterium]
MRSITVELGGRSYPIMIEDGILEQVGPAMARLGLAGRCTVVTNPTVGGLYAETVLRSMREGGLEPLVVEIPDGEEYKTLDVAATVYDRMIEARMERTSPVVALGGGVVGDLAGFVAATYLRGVPYVQVPTTLLAQVDSSVGGKTAVNHRLGKNLIGAFHQPAAVFIDPAALATLPRRDFRAGLAEVVKYGVIEDARFFEFLETNTDAILGAAPELESAIARSCEIKARIVSCDETEQGLRAVLNLGHTFGHAIETLAGYGEVRHGEAVAVGMVMAAALSVRLGLCDDGVAGRIRRLVGGLGLPVERPPLPAGSILDAMRVDKKVKAGRIRFVLVEDIGRVVIREVDDAELSDFLGH